MKLTRMFVFAIAVAAGLVVHAQQTHTPASANCVSWQLNGNTNPICDGSPQIGNLALTESATPCTNAASGIGVLCADSADHALSFSGNNGTRQNVTQTTYLTGSAYTNATTTFSNVTGLAFPVSASRNYSGRCVIVWQGSAGTSGPKYQFTGPGSPTAIAARMSSTVTATTFIAAAAVAFSSAMANTGTITTATNFSDDVSIGVLNGVTAGTVQLQAAANGAGTLTIQPGSFCDYQ